MGVLRLRLPLAFIGLLLVLAFCGQARAASSAVIVPRPTEGGPYAYTTTEAPPVISAHAVVHYVTTGADAPALNDDNQNGIPDYVEQVSAAAEKSLTMYAQQGYLAPSDYGWPNPTPDIYIHSLPSGVFGETFAPVAAEGGTFVVISNHLDEALKAFGSLDATVAHELFHVIQYTYIPDGELPAWVAEGQASAMEFVVYPEVQDIVSQQYLDGWLAQPWLPLYDQSQGCSHCYGGALWWYSLNAADHGLIREYLGRLWGYKQAGRPLLLATQPLDEILQKRGFGSLYQAYTSFSLAIYRAGLQPGLAYRIKPTKKAQATKAYKVAGLSTHYIQVQSFAAARGLVLGVVNGGGPAPAVKMVLGGPKGRVIAAKLSDHGRRALFDVRFRNAKERQSVVLIITSGRQNGVAYRAVYLEY